MAREHPAVPKASSSQKKVQRFDGESSDDDEDTNVNKSNKVAMAKKQSSAKDMSRLFTRKVDEEEEPIKFYIVELDVEWGVVVELQAQIAECGGEVVDERPAEGYSLVDLRTDAGVLELSAHSTRTRRVVSHLFVEESIERGKLVPPLELNLFVKGDRPVKFHLHDSLPRNEIEDLRKDILLRGGNPDVALAEAQVVIHSRGFRDAPIAMRTWRQIELFETSDWLKSCMSMKRFAIAGAGGRLTVRPAPTVIPAAQPGRKVGAPRTEFTEHDDMCLVAWMAFQFGKNQTGRQGNKPYQLLVQDPNQLWWASRHTWHSWRERYKTKRVRFDPLIIQAVDEMEDNKTPRQRQRELRLPKFAVNEESDSDEQEDIPQAPAPSAAKAKPKRAKRKAHDRDDEDAQSSPPPVKQIKKSSTQVKMGTQPEKAPVIKTSASQKAREAPRFSTPAREPSHSPPAPGPVSPPADEHMREASPVTGPGEEQEREDSQASTQLDTGILDQEVLGSGAQGAISRYNAELAQVASDEMEFEGDEGYTVDDPDVDVVGITQVDTSRSMTANGSHLEDSESRTGSSSESTQVGETEETLQDTVEQRLNALADRFGSRYSMVEAYYEYAVANGEPDIYEYVERQLRANLRQEKGKGRASG